MKLTVIGCQGAYPDAGKATSGYLIEEGNTRVLLDCGSGVLTKIQERCPLSELDAVVISHYHPDHCADLGCLQYAAMIDTQLKRRTKSFSAWGPEDIDTLSYYNYCMGRCYNENTAFQIDGLKFEVLQNIHEVASWREVRLFAFYILVYFFRISRLLYYCRSPCSETPFQSAPPSPNHARHA